MDAQPKTEVTVAVVVLSSSRNLEGFFKSEGDKFKIIRIRYVFTWYYWLISELTGVISYYADKYALTQHDGLRITQK